MMRRPVEPMLTEYLHTKASRLGIPLNGTFELTPLCNMNCRMCYVRMDREQQESIAPLRTAEEWLELGRTAKERGMTYLLLTGGEPFLRPDFRQIMQGLHRMGFVMSINSNGTLIDESTVEWLKETPPVRINITLYGASDETYGRLCRNPRGFTQVTKAIRLLKEAGILVKLNCSVTPYNAGDLNRSLRSQIRRGWWCRRLLICSLPFEGTPPKWDGTIGSLRRNPPGRRHGSVYISMEKRRGLSIWSQMK